MGMSLYEIDARIEALIDPETGEISDWEQLEQLQMDRSTKIDNVACWLKNLKAEAEALRTEEKRLQERRAKVEKMIASRELYLIDALAGGKHRSARCEVKTTPSYALAIAENAQIPKNFIVETVTMAPDKNAIKKALKAGTTIPGCEIVTRINLQIK